MSDRPRSDPPTDSLTTLRQFETLRPHLHHDVALTEVARAADIPHLLFYRCYAPPRR